jgi:transcriptional regulator GlxA family with amidase domain
MPHRTIASMVAPETTIAFLAVEGCMASSARTAAELVAYANASVPKLMEKGDSHAGGVPRRLLRPEAAKAVKPDSKDANRDTNPACDPCLAEPTSPALYCGDVDRLRLVVASVDGLPVRTFGGEALEVSCSFAELCGPVSRERDTAGRIAVPAALIPVVLGPLDPLLADGRIAAAIASLASGGCVIAAACDAVFLAAGAGLLDGRSVAVHPSLRVDFRRRFPAVRVDEEATRCSGDGVIISVGSGSFADLMVETLRTVAGPAVADRCGRVFLDRSGATAVFPASGGAVNPEGSEPASRVASLIEARYSEPLEIASLAAEVGATERTLSRRFARIYGLSPAAYLRARRSAAAAALLVSSTLAVEEIAWRVGYADASAFARAFRAYSGASPAAYRNAASKAAVRG